ncbi:MAG: ATP-binding protein [Acidimicrobiales bacterium]
MSDSPFFGRSSELEILNGELDRVVTSGSGCLMAIRGRRQVGKSRLVEHFLQQGRVPYGSVVGLKGTPVEVQMHRALETLRSSTRPLPGLDAVTAVTPSNWYDLLSRLGLALGSDPAILVVDEFPWAEEASRGLDGLLQSVWDQDLSRRPVLMILVGSDQAMMDRQFAHDRPLFGRLDQTVVVEPFNPAETAQALGGVRTPMAVFDAQLVTGGFPELVAHARRFGSLTKLVEDALSRPHTVLSDVAQINLAGELADAGNIRVVLEAIGADAIGVVNFSRIASTLGGSRAAETAIVRAMDALVGVKRIVAVDVPAGRRNERLKRYRIADSYLRFWFAFIAPHLRNIEVGRSDLAVRAFHSSWATWRGKAIEPLLREALLRLAPRLAPPLDGIESVGGWWDRSGMYEYDIVASNRSSAIVAIGSIKWREKGSFDPRDLATLGKARSVIPGAERASLVAVAPQGATSGLAADLVLDAGDLLGAWV